MRTVPYKSALWAVARKMGLDPATNLLADQAATLTEYINEQVREGWEFYDWPELCPIEERAYRDAFDNAHAYVAGDQVYYATTGKYYEATQGTTGNLPTDTSYWTELTAIDKFISLDQTGQTPIGEVFNVYRRNPRLYRNAGELGKGLSENGIQLDLDAPATVWVYFRSRPPLFDSTPWDAATSYVAGDVCYQPDDGECYRCIQAHSNHEPPAASYWEKVDFPYVLAPYVKHAAYADALREDGQNDKADREDDKAEKKLMKEIDKIEMQQGQTQRYGVRTR